MSIKSESLALTTSNQDLLSCGAGLEIVVFGLSAHNSSGGERLVTLRHYQAANARTVDHVIKVPTAAPAATAWPAKIALQPGDTLKAKCDAADVTLLWSYDQDAGADPVATNFNGRGEYDPDATYGVNDLVSVDGTSYISLVAENIGHAPASLGAYWMVNAAKGDAGSSTASSVSVTPTGGVASTNVQDAIAELDSEKQTAAQVAAAITTAVNALVAAAPGALDTLNELAAALGNDSSFSATIATALAGKQPLDATLTALAALSTAANKMIYATGSDAFAVADLTAAGRALLDDADAAAQRVTLGLVGKQTIPIVAGAMRAAATNGPASGSVETGTNKVILATLDFDAATAETAQFLLPMPKQWDEGTVSFRVDWKHAATSTNFGVAWGLSAVAFSDADALDAAFGTEVIVTDTGGTTNNLYTTAESAAVTIAGTPQAGDVVVFKVRRVVADGGDTMAIDAGLLAVRLYLNTETGNDA